LGAAAGGLFLNLTWVCNVSFATDGIIHGRMVTQQTALGFGGVAVFRRQPFYLTWEGIYQGAGNISANVGQPGGFFFGGGGWRRSALAIFLQTQIISFSPRLHPVGLRAGGGMPMGARARIYNTKTNSHSPWCCFLPRQRRTHRNQYQLILST